MKMNVKPIPEGCQTLTPLLTVQNAAGVIDFYKKAFDAEERFRMPTPDGKWIDHAELKIGDSILMLSDEMPGQECRSPLSLGGTPVGFYMCVEDVDIAFKAAIDASAKVKTPVQDMFWGDRVGVLVDPSGHVWTLATHVEDLTLEEIEKRGRETFAKIL